MPFTYEVRLISNAHSEIFCQRSKVPMRAQCVLVATTLLQSGAMFHSFLYTSSKTVRVSMESCYGGMLTRLKQRAVTGNTVNSARNIKTIKKTYDGGCVDLGSQHSKFCCCMTTQDRTMLAQRLMLWRRWSLRFSPIRPTALTWRQAISISFLTSRGISRGLISPQKMKWSKLWRRGSNKELLNSSLTARVNLFYVGKNVLNDKVTMSKNKYVNL